MVEAEGPGADDGLEGVKCVWERLVFEHIRVVPVVESITIYIFASALERETAVNSAGDYHKEHLNP